MIGYRKDSQCRTCAYYTTDEDENGCVGEFHHDRNKESAFCAMRELFYEVKASDKACEYYFKDGEGR